MHALTAEWLVLILLVLAVLSLSPQFVSLSLLLSDSSIQLIDYFLVFAVLTGVAQFAYLLLVGQFPFNSFLAGFFAAVGFFVFTGQLLHLHC
jgi:hypothetical protein